MFNLTRNQIIKIADQHLMGFDIMLKMAPNPNINVKECNHYITIWNGIKEIAEKTESEEHIWNNLAPFEKAQVLQAIVD